MLCNKNQGNLVTKTITDKEWELIDTIRNYRNAFPNGARMMKAEIQDLLDELMDLEYSEIQEENEENEEKEN